MSTTASRADPASLPVSVVLPCLNEANSLARCIDGAREALTGLGLEGEIIVADNGSTDGSATLAESLGARVVAVPERGYGSAVRGGLAAARGEVALIGDADATYDFRDLPKLIRPIFEGRADLVVGSRLNGEIERGAMPWSHRYLGTPFLTWVLNRLYGLRIADSQSGMRAFRVDAMRKLDLRSQGMELASEMLAKAARGGLRISEIPIRYLRPIEGRATHLRPLRDGWRHVRFLLLFGPLGIFLYPGLVAGGVGLVLLGLALFEPRIAGHQVSFHFAILGGTLALLGAQICTLGLYARTYSILMGYMPEGKLAHILAEGRLWHRAASLGGLLAALGTTADLFVLASWIQGGLEPLPSVLTGTAILSSTLIVLGFHLCFWALLLEVLHGRSRSG